jgi:hypothetical protein
MIDKPKQEKQYFEQATVFVDLLDRVKNLLERFGRPDYLPNQSKGDFAVHSDYSGYPQVVVFVENLIMLRPNVVSALQNLIRKYPGWQIEVTIAVPGHDDDWPDMGLYIRPHEVVDALQRQYFPKEFQDIAYAAAKKGTAYD